MESLEATNASSARSTSEESPAMEKPALLFKALGHPTRLAIVDALDDGERSVLALRGIVGFDVSTVSRHLLQLKAAGVLTSRRDGKQVLYRLRTPCVATVMRCVTSIVGDALPQGAANDVSSTAPCGSLCPSAVAAVSASAPAGAQSQGSSPQTGR